MIEKVKAKAKEKLARNDAAHDYHHAVRVDNLSNEIRKHEDGDELILRTSSYMHDWCAYLGREAHVGEGALLIIKNELVILEFPLNKLEPVIEVIKHHEDYDFTGKRRKKLSKECLILQDADRLDSLGDIGIARCFYTTAKLGYPLGTIDDMHKLDEPYHISQITSAIQHFYTKLLNLKDSMNTDYARQLAQGRHDSMLKFLDRFKLEWNGKI